MPKRINPNGIRHDRYGGPWVHAADWQDRVRSKKERLRRDFQVGSGSTRYSYALGMNFCVLSGRVVRRPMTAGLKRREWVWFRLGVPNQDRRGQWLFIPVRTSGALAYFTFANIDKGDTVCVMGRMWTGSIRPKGPDGRRTERKQFTFLVAEQVSPSHPVLMDKDPRYVRVRIDLFNRMASASEEMHPMRIPEANRRDLDVPPPETEIRDYDSTELEVGPEQDEPRSDITNQDDEDDDENDGSAGDSGGDGGDDSPGPERGEALAGDGSPD